MSEYLYSAILFWIEPTSALRLCSVLNGITQFYLPPTRFILARAEHYIRNELVNVATHFTDLERMEAWVKLSAREWSWTSTVHDWTCIWVGALTNWASQADNNKLHQSSLRLTSSLCNYRPLLKIQKMSVTRWIGYALSFVGGHSFVDGRWLRHSLYPCEPLWKMLCIGYYFVIWTTNNEQFCSLEDIP